MKEKGFFHKVNHYFKICLNKIHNKTDNDESQDKKNERGTFNSRFTSFFKKSRTPLAIYPPLVYYF